ncbi:MAG TPA: hypothetical protein VKV24_00640 [Casimicrobiaceae bacterium]|nr:hypothetical protein [Casimicrobiaceae bacterium]
MSPRRAGRLAVLQPYPRGADMVPKFHFRYCANMGAWSRAPLPRESQSEIMRERLMNRTTLDVLLVVLLLVWAL